jgi:hypothetical protein
VLSLQRFISSRPGMHRARTNSQLAGVAVWLSLLCVWLARPGQIAAQTPLVDVNVERMYPIRSESPVVLRVRMTPINPQLVKGRLEFRLLSGTELVSTLIADDEIINPPSKTVRYVLPSPESPVYSQQLELYVDFVSTQGDFGSKQNHHKYPPNTLIVPMFGERELIIGAVAPSNKVASAELDALLQSLKLENLTPEDADNKPLDKSVRTLISNFTPEELPSDATSYCSFNMLFIAAEGFATLRESQWPALLDWVEAGGSLCLMPDTNLTAQHIDALNRLVQHRPDKQTFLQAPNNEVRLKDEDAGKRYILLRRGLGRIAIIPIRSEQPIDPNSSMWRSVVGHLWNVRSDQLRPFLSTGKWDPSILRLQDAALRGAQPGTDYYRSSRTQQRQLAHIPINSGDAIIQSIMPSDLRIIPLSLIAFILFLYVLAIGPADYFILGRLKLRKWTWVTFPVTTVLFAGGALWMAEWYMNTGDARRSVFFVDIGVEGNPERTTQLEMLFNSRQKVVETHLKRSLFTPLNHQDYGAASYQAYRRRRGLGGTDFGGKTVEITGRIPSNFVARQLTPKWVPQLNRITSVLTGSNVVTKDSDPPEKEEPAEYAWPQPEIDWKQFELKELPDWSALHGNQEWRDSIVTPIRAKFPGQDVQIGICAGGKYIPLHVTHPLFHAMPGVSQRNSQGQIVTPINGNFANGQSRFMADITMLQDGGLFGVVSSIAPHGGRQLEDLSIVDPSDPRQWVLIVALPDAANWIVYRKLYAGIE